MYYLTNFETALRWVGERYADLLNPVCSDYHEPYWEALRVKGDERGIRPEVVVVGPSVDPLLLGPSRKAGSIRE